MNSHERLPIGRDTNRAGCAWLCLAVNSGHGLPLAIHRLGLTVINAIEALYRKSYTAERRSSRVMLE
jgi:hypothetical protein